MQTKSPRSGCASNSDPDFAIDPRRAASRWGVVSLLIICLLRNALGSDVQVIAKDQTGRPVEGAVVWAEVSRGGAPAPVRTEIVQKNRQFIPPVTVVPVGSLVRFPNWDNVQHHVYSFSAAKTFDIPLYIGESPKVIEFGSPGIVSLGCNIHDWMFAYIVVLDTAVFAKTDASGIALLRNLPPEAVSIVGWCPRLRGEPVKVDLQAGRSSVELTMKLRPVFQRTPPDDRGGSYR
jgi:plastocyanin